MSQLRFVMFATFAFAKLELSRTEQKDFTLPPGYWLALVGH